MNVFHFSRHPMDFSHYDISPCFEEPQKRHLMIRMGWSPSMDLEQSKRMFNDEFRREVMLTGQVTNIRIVNIEVRKMMEFYHFTNFFRISRRQLMLTTPPCLSSGRFWITPRGLIWSWMTFLMPSDL